MANRKKKGRNSENSVPVFDVRRITAERKERNKRRRENNKGRAKYSYAQWYYIKKWGKKKGFIWATWEDKNEEERVAYINKLPYEERARVQHNNRKKKYWEWSYRSPKHPPPRRILGEQVPSSSRQSIQFYFPTIAITAGTTATTTTNPAPWDELTEEGN